MAVAKDLKERVEERVLECICAAEARFGKNVPYVPVTYRNMGRTAGQHKVERAGGEWRHELAFNDVLLAENGDAFLSRTVPHEVAHYVVAAVFGRGRRSHGSEWAMVMEQVFGLPARRCHSYDTSRSRKRVWRYVYRCACREHRVSGVRHMKMVRGHVDYRCLGCGGSIRFTGERRRA